MNGKKAKMKNGKKKNGKIKAAYHFVYLSFKFRVFLQIFLRLFFWNR
jgi:hypothetical protein